MSRCIKRVVLFLKFVTSFVLLRPFGNHHLRVYYTNPQSDHLYFFVFHLYRLHYVLNSAARVVKLSKKHDHISPVLVELHWLPIEQRIEFKILIYVFKVVNDMAPSYLQELLELYKPTRSLRSGNKKHLKI